MKDWLCGVLSALECSSCTLFISDMENGYAATINNNYKLTARKRVCKKLKLNSEGETSVAE